MLLVPVKPWHMCAASGHRSSAWLHLLLGMVSLLRCFSRVHAVIARLHACSLVGMATPSLTSRHIFLQLWAAEYEVARLVAVVAGARPRAATSTTMSTMSTCKISKRSISCMALSLGLPQLHWSGALMPCSSPTWGLSHRASKMLHDQHSSHKIHRLYSAQKSACVDTPQLLERICACWMHLATTQFVIGALQPQAVVC